MGIRATLAPVMAAEDDKPANAFKLAAQTTRAAAQRIASALFRGAIRPATLGFGAATARLPDKAMKPLRQSQSRQERPLWRIRR
ncbi:MAG TPA: hypothetical protein VJ718_01610, partial [Candidatus Binataceae bacterium]|nr:hypothetical protein [Candidatus Binataceae bacterium]